MNLDEECIAALKEVAAAEKVAPINALTSSLKYPMQLGHLMFEGYIFNNEAGDLFLTTRGRLVIEAVT